MDNATLKAAIEKRKKMASPDELVLISLIERFQKELKGDKGEKGDKGDDPSPKELLALIAPLIPKPIKGDKGDDSTVPGPQGKPGAKGDSASIDYQAIYDFINKKFDDIPIPKNGMDGMPGRNGDEVDAKEIVTKLESLTGSERLDVAAIKGLAEQLSTLQRAIREQRQVKHGGSGGGGGITLDLYDLSPYLDGTKKTFTIASSFRIRKIHQVTSSSEPFIFRPTVDFTYTSTSITFTAAVDAPSMLAAGQSILIEIIH